MKKVLLISASFILALYVGLTVYALWPVEEQDPVAFASSFDRFIDVDGVSIRYIEAGDPGEPVVLLVHGFAGSVYTYRKLIPLLSSEYRVIALDLPGFGLSDKPSDYDYSYGNQGRLVSSFMDSMKLENVSLVGHSMGGNIVLHSARDNRKVSHLILLDPGIIEDGNPEFLKYLFFPLTRISAKMFRDRDFRMSSFEHAYYHRENITEEDVKAYMVASQTDNFVNALETMLKGYKDPNEIEIVPEIEQPVLLLWGRHDRGNPPENGLTLNSLFPDSQLHIIEDSGHYIHEEQPDETGKLIMDFLQNY